MLKAWAIPIAYVVMALTQLIVAARTDGTARLVALVCAVALLAVGAYFRPRSLPQATYEQATRAAADGRVVIYHRPGCVYCARLVAALGRTGRESAVWVDIWRDADGAAYVRSVNDGNETVPTVVIAGTPHTNPPPAQVKAALGR